MPKPEKSSVLTLRVPKALDRRIEQAARRKRQSKSAALREILQGAFAGQAPPADPAREARRQSLLVSGRPSEQDELDFIEHSADHQGWK